MPAPAEWTVLIYMAADNNLDKYALRDLEELAAAEPGPGMRVIVQADRRKIYMPEEGTWSDARRFLITGKSKGGVGYEPVGPPLGETNTGDPEALKEFLVWGLTAYPAKRHMVVLWNHGGGWKEDDIYADRPAQVRGKGLVLNPREMPVDRYICTDDTSRDFLDNAELEDALSLRTRMRDPMLEAARLEFLRGGFGRFDVLGFDACMMSMLEIAYQVRHVAGVVIGSEETAPQDGWPYTPILRKMTAEPAVGSEDLAAFVVDQFVDSYRSRDKAVTQSALKVDALVPLAEAVDALGRLLVERLPALLPSLRMILPEVQRFKDQDYADLFDLAGLMAKHLPHEEARKQAERVKAEVSRVVLKHGSLGKEMANSRGLAIFLPCARLSEAHQTTYRKLDFSRDYPHWLEFLEGYSSSSLRLRDS